MLYPQNGDHIVAIDYVTSLQPMYTGSAKKNVRPQTHGHSSVKSQPIFSVQDFFGKICSFVHYVRLASTLLINEESARDNHSLACNFAKYL